MPVGITLVSQQSTTSPLTPGGWSPAVLTNGEAAPITLGQVCYLSADTTAKLAKSNSTLAIASAVCMCIDASIAAGATGRFVFGGLVTGLSGGTVNTLGYLGTTFGAIAASPDVTPGEYNTLLGLWLSATVFSFAPQLPIAN
jgi:hypothetical protein